MLRRSAWGTSVRVLAASSASAGDRLAPDQAMSAQRMNAEAAIRQGVQAMARLRQGITGLRWSVAPGPCLRQPGGGGAPAVPAYDPEDTHRSVADAGTTRTGTVGAV